MKSDIYLLADTLEDDLASSYGGDEFYDKALRVLRENRYDLRGENIMEITESDPYDVDDYLEVIGQFVGRDSEYSVSFVLEDSREKDFTPKIEFVSGLEDFLGPE